MLKRAPAGLLATIGVLCGPALGCQEPQPVAPEKSAAATSRAAPDGAARLREFLLAVDDDTLRELSSQVAEGGSGKRSRDTQIESVLQHLFKEGAEPLKLAPRSPRSLNIELEAGETYMMEAPERAWNSSVVEENGKRRARVTRDAHAPVTMMLVSPATRVVDPGQLQAVCINELGYAVFYAYEFTEGTFTIPAKTILMTPASTLRFPHGLVMGEGAMLVGTHPCGLRVEALFISGAGSACDASRITTSANTTGLIDSSCQTQWTPLHSEIFRVRKNCRSEVLNINGASGFPGTNHFIRYGADGADGSCDWNIGICFSFTAPRDGKTLPDGLDGGNAGDGGSGRSTADLHIVTNDLRGTLCLSTQAGNGGFGGGGGNGETLMGGRGGSLSRWCESCDEYDIRPGKGGSVGVAGDGGDGGDGGNGGDAGDIYLELPSTAWDEDLHANTNLEDHVLAIVRGGRQGLGRRGGEPGTANPGPGGGWINHLDDGMEWSGRNGSGPAREAVPGTGGQNGRRGLNGRVHLNGVLMRGTDDQRVSDAWMDFTWPFRPSSACAQD